MTIYALEYVSRISPIRVLEYFRCNKSYLELKVQGKPDRSELKSHTNVMSLFQNVHTLICDDQEKILYILLVLCWFISDVLGQQANHLWSFPLFWQVSLSRGYHLLSVAIYYWVTYALIHSCMWFWAMADFGSTHPSFVVSTVFSCQITG